MESCFDLPPGPFGCIMADPPWRFTDLRGVARVPQTATVQHYQTMSRAELVGLDVASVAAKDSVLILWTTSANLAEAVALGEAWGFAYKSIAFVWVKTLKPVDQMGFFPAAPSYRMSLGYWTRQQAEIALLFTRGKPKRVSKGVRQVIAEPRREHSRKPDEAHSRVEALVAGPYLELFARAPRPGWTVWGNDVDKFAGPTS